jgi:hypothetical protein
VSSVSKQSQDSIVGKVTRSRAGQPRNRGSIPTRGRRCFSSLIYPDRPNSEPVPYSVGTVPISVEVRQLRHEADHSPTPSTRVKNKWHYAVTPHPHFFMVCTGTNLPFYYESEHLCFLFWTYDNCDLTWNHFGMVIYLSVATKLWAGYSMVRTMER